jgi:hypothetical protein
MGYRLIRHCFFFIAPDNTSLATTQYMASKIDSWLLTRGFESYRNSLKSAGSKSKFGMYLKQNAIHDVDNHVYSPRGTPPTGKKPQRNNIGWEVGDLADIRDNHNNWLLRTPSGSYVLEPNPTGKMVYTDIANSDYRAFVRNRVNAYMWNAGWDYLFFDNMNINFTAATGDPVTTQQYGDGASDKWHNANLSYLQFIRDQVTGPRGAMLGGNLQGENFPRWAQVAAKLEVVMIEFFSMWKDGGQKSVSSWLRDLQKVEYCEANNKEAWCVIPINAASAYNGDATQIRKMMFGIASYLLVVGTKACLRAGGPPYSKYYHHSQFQQLQELGIPKGRYYQASSNTWRRDFTNGYVTVNPSTFSSSIVYTQSVHPSVTLPPIIVPPYNQMSTAGENVSMQLNYKDPQGLAVSFSATQLPAGLGINSSGRVTGLIVTNNPPQIKHSTTITARNSAGASVDVKLAWDVKPGNLEARINCGGPEVYPLDATNATNWQRDETAKPHATLSVNGSSGTSNSTLPMLHRDVPSWVPDEALRTCRWDSGSPYMTYNIPVSAGRKYVLLGFDEIEKTGAGQRIFDVLINGTVVLRDFDVFAQAGGRHIGITRGFMVNPSGGRITVSLNVKRAAARISTIEVWNAPVGGVVVTPVPTNTPVPPVGTLAAPTATPIPPVNTQVPPTPVPTQGGGTGQRVTSFTLINATTDRDIRTINNGDTIDLAQLGTTRINIRANTSPATVGSVVFRLDGNARYKVENGAPYAIGSNNGSDYNAWNYTMGAHTVTATPYSSSSGSGTAGSALTVNFTIVNGGGSSEPAPTATTSSSGQRVTSFTLINADTNKDIRTLTNGEVVNLAQIGTTRINIRANTSPATVGSVVFALNSNSRYKVENGAPYAIGSNSGSDYHAWNYPTGSLTLKATPYQWSNGGGTAGTPLTVNFSIVNGTSSNPEGDAIVQAPSGLTRRDLFRNLFSLDDTI